MSAGSDPVPRPESLYDLLLHFQRLQCQNAASSSKLHRLTAALDRAEVHAWAARYAHLMLLRLTVILMSSIDVIFAEFSPTGGPIPRITPLPSDTEALAKLQAKADQERRSAAICVQAAWRGCAVQIRLNSNYRHLPTTAHR